MYKSAVFAGLAMAVCTIGASAQITGGGTSGTVPQFTGASSIGNSPISVNGGKVGIGTSTPTEVLHSAGAIRVEPLFPQGSGVGAYVFSDSNTAFFASYGPDASTQGNVWLSSYKSDGSGGYNMAEFAPSQIVFNTRLGIGTSTPGATLEVNGNVKLSTGSGASVTFPDSTVQSTAWTGTLTGGDYAESVDITGQRDEYKPGDVIVIDPSIAGKFGKSSLPYSTAVAGVYSTKPGVIGRRQQTARENMKDEVPMAMTGIVPVKVTAENGPIHPGDLLVTSSKLGYAMKGTDRSLMLGAVIGKAIGNIDSGAGIIEAVITLQ